MLPKCTVLLCTCVSSLLTDATVTIVPSDYTVDESQSSVQICASLTDIPAGGLECEVVATINTTDGPLASMSPVLYSCTCNVYCLYFCLFKFQEVVTRLRVLPSLIYKLSIKLIRFSA